MGNVDVIPNRHVTCTPYAFRLPQLLMAAPIAQHPLEQYESLDIIGNGSFGVIRKVRRKSDGVVGEFAVWGDVMLKCGNSRSWRARSSTLSACQKETESRLLPKCARPRIYHYAFTDLVETEIYSKNCAMRTLYDIMTVYVSISFLTASTQEAFSTLIETMGYSTSSWRYVWHLPRGTTLTFSTVLRWWRPRHHHQELYSYQPSLTRGHCLELLSSDPSRTPTLPFSKYGQLSFVVLFRNTTADPTSRSKAREWYVFDRFVFIRLIPGRSVFLDTNQIIKLGDFGLSKALGAATFAHTYVGVSHVHWPTDSN